MDVLLIGGGGREHALAMAISQSPRLGVLHAAPGNPGIADVAKLAELDAGDHAAVIDFCKTKRVDLVVVGPEAPLVAGLADDLRAEGIACFGPGKEAARLEGSKSFTKELCDEAGIPTAAYARFEDLQSAKAYVSEQPVPIVIKADGLAAGKGVAIAESQADAMGFLEECFGGKFGTAGSAVVIEEFLVGEEASFFVLSDGTDVLPLATAQDHKRVGEGDTGPNTGGMGAYSPAPVMTDTLVEQSLTRIIRPTVKALADRGTPYRGVLYAGLMVTDTGPKLIEYNVRFGDPEAQVLVLRADPAQLLEALHAAAHGSLSGMEIAWSDKKAITVVMAARGYPGTPETGSVINGLERASKIGGVKVFHAGTKLDATGRLVASGGRVLNVTALGHTIAEAQARAYDAVSRIDWPEGFCRRDIGWRAVEREWAKKG